MWLCVGGKPQRQRGSPFSNSTLFILPPCLFRNKNGGPESRTCTPEQTQNQKLNPRPQPQSQTVPTTQARPSTLNARHSTPETDREPWTPGSIHQTREPELHTDPIHKPRTRSHTHRASRSQTHRHRSNPRPQTQETEPRCVTRTPHPHSRVTAGQCSPVATCRSRTESSQCKQSQEPIKNIPDSLSLSSWPQKHFFMPM